MWRRAGVLAVQCREHDAATVAAKKWHEVTLAGESAKLGGTPGSDLSGALTGVGFIATFAQHQTVNVHFLEIDAAAAPAASEEKMK